jgi:hypothetical protein
MTSVELCVSSVDLCVTKRKIRTYTELHRDYTEGHREEGTNNWSSRQDCIYIFDTSKNESADAFVA